MYLFLHALESAHEAMTSISILRTLESIHQLHKSCQMYHAAVPIKFLCRVIRQFNQE
jgi:hypothetical protein